MQQVLADGRRLRQHRAHDLGGVDLYTQGLPEHCAVVAGEGLELADHGRQLVLEDGCLLQKLGQSETDGEDAQAHHDDQHDDDSG
jgi:hypothetical protein